MSNWYRPNVHKLEIYLKWYKNKFKRKLIYSFREKYWLKSFKDFFSFIVKFFLRMLPHIQLDIEESNLYISEANELVCIELEEIYNYKASKYHENKLTQQGRSNRSTNLNRNDIKVNSILRVFDRNDDIYGFVKKSNYLVNFTK